MVCQYFLEKQKEQKVTLKHTFMVIQTKYCKAPRENPV